MRIEDDSLSWCHLCLKLFLQLPPSDTGPLKSRISYPFNGGTPCGPTNDSGSLSQVHSTNPFLPGSHLPRLSEKN